MAVVLAQNRISGNLLRVIRKTGNEELAPDLVIASGELPIIDFNTLLGLPLNDNRVDLEATVLSLLNLNRSNCDARLTEITRGYEYTASRGSSRQPSCQLTSNPKLGLVAPNREIYTR